MKKIHHALKFNKSQCLKPYAELNIQKDKDGKALYKLINNAVYRKTVENL